MNKILTAKYIDKSVKKKEGLWVDIIKDFRWNKSLYLMILPVIVFYLIFAYKPMYGAIIAFKNYSPRLGIIKSPWVGFTYFKEFVEGVYFWRIFGNTLTISISQLVFGFPAPIILALLINELKNKYFKKTIQTVSYLPHFISLVVVCGMIKEFSLDRGLFNDIISFFGGERFTLLSRRELFVPIYVLSNIWKNVGWESIIYLAALSGIDQELYEAARIDGANRWRQTIHITVPGLMSTIIVLLILRIGNILNVGYEMIILLYNSVTMEVADVISTYVYRKGLQDFSWSFSTAVGLFNSVINFMMLMLANILSRKYNNSGLW